MTAKELYEQLKTAGLENTPLTTNSDENEGCISLICGWAQILKDSVFLETED